MNTTIKYSLFSLLALLLASCNDNFLERYPLDRISGDTYWNTENDLAVYNNSLYHMTLNNDEVPILHGHSAQDWSSVWNQDEMTDNVGISDIRHEFFSEIRAGKHNIPSNPGWFGYKGWNFVRAINVGLANYGNADIPQEIIDRYAGEARLLRGWFYAEKVSKYGDVPWIDRELNIDSEELYAARTPREEAMAHVLDDLNFAVQKLPADWNDGNAPGRLNRWAALLVKSRVCLFEGTWRKYHGGSDAEMWLTEAASAAKALMDDGPYRLYVTGDPQNDYNAYHRVLDLTGNPEVLYWRKFKVGVLTNHIQLPFTQIVSGSKSLVEDYLAIDGLPITLSELYEGDDVIEDVFKNRDPRLRQSILHPDDKAKYKYHLDDDLSYPRLPGMGTTISVTGYHIIKFYNADDMIGKAYNTGESPAIILRFGEALLNYAEALAELGSITQHDLDISINKLRDRVGMPHLTLDVPMDPKYANDGVSALIVEVRRERRIELFCEGFRYNDLRRWKQGKKLAQPTLGIRWNDAAIARFPDADIHTTIDPGSGKTYIDVHQGSDWANPVFDESKHYLWPIPLNELAQNPNIEQNPGWDH